MSDPIVVGGTGGSGTRLVALLLQHAGVFMGNDVNYAMDSMPMNRVDMYYLRAQGSNLTEEVKSRIAEQHEGYAGSLRWGWKHTFSFLTLPMLHRFFPDMMYVHIVRDGRDMAYALYGPLVCYGVASPTSAGPETLIALWEITNVLCADYGENFVKGYCRVRYEDLCRNPTATIGMMYKFLGLEGDVEGARSLIRPSAGMGRWRGREGLERVEEIGGYGLKRFGY